jgi:hypothetical protein
VDKNPFGRGGNGLPGDLLEEEMRSNLEGHFPPTQYVRAVTAAGPRVPLYKLIKNNTYNCRSM